jgi:hypothetical protein
MNRIRASINESHRVAASPAVEFRRHGCCLELLSMLAVEQFRCAVDVLKPAQTALSHAVLLAGVFRDAELAPRRRRVAKPTTRLCSSRRPARIELMWWPFILIEPRRVLSPEKRRSGL